jgi:subtilisin-like proprotein convertase family protein
MLLFISTKAQVSTTYTFSQSAGTYTAITGGTVVANINMGNLDDFVAGPIALPAPFVFDGVPYSDIYISTNGFVAFGARPSETEYYPLSGIDPALGIIAPFGGDLDESFVNGTPSIRYRYVGTEFIVQWANYSRYGDADRISFQVRLNTANNQIKVVYGNPQVMELDPFGLEVGLRGPTNTFPTDINNREVLPASGSWVNSTPGTSNASVCDFDGTNPTTNPGIGTTFTWSAPAVDLKANSIASPTNAGCYTSPQTVSVSIMNTGSTAINFATNPVTVNCNVTGPNPMTFAPVTVNTGTLAVNATVAVTVSTNYDMSAGGNYIFTASTTASADLHIGNDAMSPVTIYSHTPGIAASDVTICTGSSTTLATTATALPFDLDFTNSTDLVIPDDDPVGANQTIVVSGVPVPASQVTITINSLTHTWVSDLVFTITAPDGSSIVFCNENGGSGQNFAGTVFSSSAVTPISAGNAPFTGTFLPDNPFSGLTGTANGNWVLNIADLYAPDDGTLHSWTLSFSLPNSIVSYTWSPATGLSSTTIANPVANPTTTTNYTVTVVDESGCTNSDQVVVTVNPLPTVTANSTASAICAGGSVTLSGSGATTYTWSGSVTDNVAFSPTATDTYTVTGTDGNGCTNTDMTTVTVNPLPLVVANSTASAICAGGSVTLSGSGATTYTWSGSVTDNVAFSPTATDTYTVTGTDGNGCTNTDMTTVTVNALPSVVANSTASVICAGGSVTLSGSGAATYTWTGSVTDNVAFSPTTTDTYTVTGTDGNGCTNTDMVTVTVNPLPNVTVTLPLDTICLNGGNFMLLGESPSGGTWSGNGVTGNMLDPIVAGQGMNAITYTFTDGNGCSASANESVWIDLCSDVNVIASENFNLEAYPNPNNGEFTIRISNAGEGMLEITDALGQLIYVESIKTNGNTLVKPIDLSAQANGIYFVRFITASSNSIQKISVQK